MNVRTDRQIDLLQNDTEQQTVTLNLVAKGTILATDASHLISDLCFDKRSVISKVKGHDCTV